MVATVDLVEDPVGNARDRVADRGELPRDGASDVPLLLSHCVPLNLSRDILEPMTDAHPYTWFDPFTPNDPRLAEPTEEDERRMAEVLRDFPFGSGLGQEPRD